MQSGLLVFTDFVGIVAFALAGILAAENRKVDPVGVFVMAFTTAFGGGLVRDLIIDNRPMYWIAHQEYVWVTLFMAGCAPFLIKRFAAGGTSISLTMGLPYLPAVLMGVCTGVFGGLLRDAFLNRLPLVMSDKQPYASAAFAGAWFYILMHEAGISEFFSLFASTFFIVGVRMVCWYKQWEVIHYDFFSVGRKGIGTNHRKSP